jgi:hypothetical protein
MDQLVDNITTIKVTPRRRRGGGGYCFPIGCRAAYAADMVRSAAGRQNGPRPCSASVRPISAAP